MRTYGEAIEVRTADPAEVRDVATTDPALATPPAQLFAPPAQLFAPPAQFLWRGRLYLVREVLAHWVELGTWWTARAPRTSSPASVPAVAPYAEAPRTARSVAADVGAVEREVWRVEAASGRTAQLGVYDLVRDVPAAHPASSTSPTSGSSGSPPPLPPRWRLARALD